MEYTVSSGNIFQDLELPNASDRLAKVKLASMIYDIIEAKGLTLIETTQLLGIDENKLVALKNGRLQSFSLEKLFSFLVALGQNIEIIVTPSDGVTHSGSITVVEPTLSSQK